jgi:hypothetical protein
MGKTQIADSDGFYISRLQLGRHTGTLIAVRNTT